MNRLQRLIIVLAILLSGLALAPYVALPSERLVWQRYAAAYEPLYTRYMPFIRIGPPR